MPIHATKKNPWQLSCLKQVKIAPNGRLPTGAGTALIGVNEMSEARAIETLKAERDRLRRDIEMKDLALDNARSIWEHKRDQLRAEIARAVARERERCAAVADKVDTVNGIGDIIRRLP